MEALEYGCVQYFAPALTGRPEDDDPDFYAREDYAANESRSIFTGY